MARNARLNPRQRWEEDRPMVDGMVASTVAGVTADIWRDIIAAARVEANRSTDADRNYNSVILTFAEQMSEGIKLALTNREWNELPALKARIGRGNEITIEARDYAAMRGLLTYAYLGMNPRDDDQIETPRRKLINKILKFLDVSADRRKNTWNYRDQPISHILTNEHGAKGCIQMRLAAIRSDIRFREMLDAM